MAVATDPIPQDLAAERAARRERRFARVGKITKWLDLFGLSFISPVIRMLAGDSLAQNGRELLRLLVVPLFAIIAFVTLWAYTAPMVQTKLGAIPGPTQVWEQVVNLHEAHGAQRAKAEKHYAAVEKRNQRFIERGQPEKVKDIPFTGAPTFYDQIWTSIQTVFTGFLLASIVAIPLGVMCGLSPFIQSGLNPIIQVFKPVSPLAWLPIVTFVVSSANEGDAKLFSDAFITSAFVVMLCSLWPTLINTALGVASIDKDLVNVGRVLKLGFWQKVFQLILPSALPLIFTGLRLSLGVGWMVLIAAEMLSQNPGLGKFVWDEFQNGSSDSLARIMVAVLTIGVIGLFLDRLMYALQSAFTYSAKR